MLGCSASGCSCRGAPLPLALLGALALRRRHTPLAPLLAPAVLAVVRGALTWGSLRLRIAADIPLVVLAGVAIAALPRLS